MNSIPFPAALALSAWERGTAAIKAKPPGLRDGIKSLQRLHDAIDFKVFDLASLKNVDAAKQQSELIDTTLDRQIKALEVQARSVESEADKWVGELKKTKPEPAAAIAATAAASRAAGSLQTEAATFARGIKAALSKKLAELQNAEDNAEEEEEPQQSVHRRRLSAKIVEGMRIVKHRPQRETHFIVCAGNRECLPYLGPVVGATQKALLKNAMKGNTGMKFYYGRCVFEESSYCFVGLALPSSLRTRLERGLADLTGSTWRVRVRSGAIQKADDKKDAKAS